MTDSADTSFEERIQHALSQFPGAVWDDDAASGDRRELISFESDTTTPHQVWEPRPRQPDDFPIGIPFVPDAKTLLVSRPGPPPVTMVIWSDPPSAEVALEDVVAASLADGWTTASQQPPFVEPAQLRHLLVRSGEIRLIWLLRVKERFEVCLIQAPRTLEAA
jgi:hypothetical protein